MENLADNTFTWVIKNFYSLQSEKIYSEQFVIDGCKWRLKAFPKGNKVRDSLSLYVEVADYESLPSGWKRYAYITFAVLNDTAKKSEAKVTANWFDRKTPDWGFRRMFPICRLKSKKGGFLVNGEVIKIVALIQVIDVIGNVDVPEACKICLKINDIREIDDGAEPSDFPPADWVDINGFQILASQADLARRVFKTHPETALECRTKNQELRTSYMNALLSLIKLLYKRHQGHSEDDLTDAEAGLTYMKSVGFKLDWLEKRFDKVKENEKKCARVCEMEQQLHDLEKKCEDLKTQLNKEKADILEATAPDLSFNDVV